MNGTLTREGGEAELSSSIYSRQLARGEIIFCHSLLPFADPARAREHDVIIYFAKDKRDTLNRAVGYLASARVLIMQQSGIGEISEHVNKRATSLARCSSSCLLFLFVTGFPGVNQVVAREEPSRFRAPFRFRTNERHPGVPLFLCQERRAGGGAAAGWVGKVNRPSSHLGEPDPFLSL